MFSVIFNGVAVIISLAATFMAKSKGDLPNEIWFAMLTIFFLLIALYEMHMRS